MNKKQIIIIYIHYLFIFIYEKNFKLIKNDYYLYLPFVIKHIIHITYIYNMNNIIKNKNIKFRKSKKIIM